MVGKLGGVYSRKFELPKVPRSKKLEIYGGDNTFVPRFVGSFRSSIGSQPLGWSRRWRRCRNEVEEIPRRGATTKDPYDQRAKHVVLRVFVSYTGSTGFSACPRVFKKPDNYGEQYQLRTKVLSSRLSPSFQYPRLAYFILKSLLRDASLRPWKFRTFISSTKFRINRKLRN